jgi:hypothetical protein
VKNALLNALLFFPSKEILETPASPYEDLAIETEDGERLHGWWIPAPRSSGHVLLFHGNGGNIGDRVLHAALLRDVGFDVLLVDYRG